MDVQVYHVGSPTPMTIKDADFHTEGEGGDCRLIVKRQQEVVATFPGTKWSAVVKREQAEDS